MLRMITAAREGAGGGVTDYMARLGKGGGGGCCGLQSAKEFAI